MEIQCETFGDVVVVTLPGDKLDASNANDLKQAIVPMIETNGKVVFDLARLQFVDSSGLGAILSCLRLLNGAGGDLKLCGMQRPVRSLFELVRMHRVFDIAESREAAVQAFGL